MSEGCKEVGAEHVAMKAIEGGNWLIGNPDEEPSCSNEVVSIEARVLAVSRICDRMQWVG